MIISVHPYLGSGYV